MITVTLNFGISNSLRRDLPDRTTVGQVLSDRGIMGALGFGDNVVGKIDGQAQDSGRVLRHGEELDIEVRANSKATKSNNHKKVQTSKPSPAAAPAAPAAATAPEVAPDPVTDQPKVGNEDGSTPTGAPTGGEQSATQSQS